MKLTRGMSYGYTVVEMATATALLLIAVAISMNALLHVIRANRIADVQNELDIDVQIAMERLKSDLRLSSLDEMVFYPAGPGPYTAISFPLARDDDGDGAVDLDKDGRIIWDRTLIYHVWLSQPHQLRLTTFDPRISLTPAQRQEQLNDVVNHGHGQNTYNGNNARTEVIFENLFTWSITPHASRFDGYAPILSRAAANLGSIVITPGAHTFKFQVIDKNPLSTGYKVGLDTLIVSFCGDDREAEIQTVSAAYGTVPYPQYMEAGSWSGNYQLYFPATTSNHYFSLTMSNDQWEETNFRSTGESHQNTTVFFDTTLNPYDFVVSLESAGTNWAAWLQTGDTNSSSGWFDGLKGCAVRTLLRGSDMEAGAWFICNGGKVKSSFKAGVWTLKLDAAYIAECASSNSPSMDATPGTHARFTFNGASSVTIQPFSTVWSDWIDFSIDRRKSYLVTYLVSKNSYQGTGWRWIDRVTTNVPSSFIIPSSSNPSEDDVTADVWSTRPDVITTNKIWAVRCLATSYPTNGAYTSRIFDTKLNEPQYTELSWNADVPSGSSLTLKVRTGDESDLSDAPAWNTVSAMSSPGSIAPGNNRYVQFRAEFQPTPDTMSTPRLKGVTVKWTGETRVVDVGGIFTKGPDYGLFELYVDGKKLSMGLLINLQIFKDTRGQGGTQRLTSSLTSEVYPRNTGR
ncbi:MAG: PulJ/GspJ family protein [Kiritimatiellia bacterium]